MKNLFLFLTGILLPFLSIAQKFQSGNEIIVSQPISHDLYLTGGTATVNASISGDLVIVAGTVVINDTVNGDVIIAGGKATINGYVNGDLRVIGGDVYLNDTVSEDVVISAGKITTNNSSYIQGDAFFFAGTAIIKGIILGNMTCKAGDLKFYGTAMQATDCRCGSILMDGIIKGRSTLAAQQISIGNRAAFYQDVSYWQKDRSPDFKHSIKKGSALYDPSLAIRGGNWYYVGFASAFFMIWYFAAALVFIFLIQYLFSDVMKRAADEAFNNTGRAIGRGFLFLLGVPVTALILIITLIGMPLGLLILFGYIIMMILAAIISSVIIANWIKNRRNTGWRTGSLSLIAWVVFMLLKFITLIPFFGWIIILIIRCLVFGSLVSIFYNQRQKNIAQTA